MKLMPGQTIGIVGESGCGKSTTANVMCGLQAPTCGQVYFKGTDVTKRYRRGASAIMGRVISVVFQDPATALNARMVGSRAAAWTPCACTRWAPRRESREKPACKRAPGAGTGLPSSAVLEAFCPASCRAASASAWQSPVRCRLNPDAIIADEPTSALDVSVRAQILNLLTDLKKELGLAMVFISHDIQTVRYISDEIIVMNHGQAVERGTGEQVFQHPQDAYTRLLLALLRRCCIPSWASKFAFPPVRPVPLPGAPPLRFRKVGFTSHAKCSGATAAIW